jgi:hypothetical protein
VPDKSATTELVETIRNRPLEDDGLGLVGARICREIMFAWVHDLERQLARVDRDIKQASDVGPDRGVETLENALLRFAAARKSLQALSCLALGVPTVQPAHLMEGGVLKKDKVKKSVEWDLDARLLEKRLTELAVHHAIAGELNDRLKALAGHPALRLRNEISHSLAPIGTPAELCCLQVLVVDGEAISAPKMLNNLWPRGMAEKTDISRQGLWNDALADINDGRDLLERCIHTLNQLISVVGIVMQPLKVFRNVRTGEVTLTDPRPTPASL